MSILDRIRRLFGGEEIPDEAARIYEMSKDEREALHRLETEQGKSHRHREVLIGDIEALAGEEERLTEDGRAETAPVRRRIAAKRVVEIRGKIENLMNRVDLLTQRISIFDRQAVLLRDRAVMDAPLPETAEIEAAAGEALAAKNEFERKAELASLHKGVTRLAGAEAREEEALREMSGEPAEELTFDDMVREEQGRLGRAGSEGEALAE